MNPIDVTDVQVNEDGSYFCIGIFAPTPDNAGVGRLSCRANKLHLLTLSRLHSGRLVYAQCLLALELR